QGRPYRRGGPGQGSEARRPDFSGALRTRRFGSTVSEGFRPLAHDFAYRIHPVALFNGAVGPDGGGARRYLAGTALGSIFWPRVAFLVRPCRLCAGRLELHAHAHSV